MKGKHGCGGERFLLLRFDRHVCVCRCANPNDPTVSLLKVDNLPNSRHQKRFKVDAFQFMDQKTNAYLNEEVSQKCFKIFFFFLSFVKTAEDALEM